jgi:hypothetical protein
MTESSICEWLSEKLLPKLHAKIESEGYYNLFDFFDKLRESNCSQILNDNINNFKTEDQLQLLKKCYLFDSLPDVYRYISICQHLESNLNYLAWIINLLKPILLFSGYLLTLFLFPIIIIPIFYMMSLSLFIVKHWSKIKASYSDDSLIKATVKLICVFWEVQGSIWHGHEIVGLENIPEKGAALLIYYHAAMPFDMYYVFSKLFLHHDRSIKMVVDKFLFMVPGLRSLIDTFGATTGTVDSCINQLKEG